MGKDWGLAKDNGAPEPEGNKQGEQKIVLLQARQFATEDNQKKIIGQQPLEKRDESNWHAG